MNKFNWFKIYRMADDGAGSGAGDAGAAGGASGGSTFATVAAASADANSASASIPSGIGGKSGDAAAAAAAAPDFKTSLGDLGKDPMFADFKDVTSLAKSYAETKKLVGQKLGIPGADATPEAKAAFQKAMGVPDTADGYEFAKPADLPPEVEYSEEHAKAWAQRMKDLGVPKEVANTLRNELIKEQVDGVAKAKAGKTEDTTRTDANFDQLATKAFGDKKEAALQNSRTLMEKYLSPETKASMDGAPNAHLIAFAEFASKFSLDMTGEDQVLNGGAGGSVQSEGEMRQEMRTLMATPEYSNPFAKGKDAHETVKAQVTALSNKIAKAQEAQRRKK